MFGQNTMESHFSRDFSLDKAYFFGYNTIESYFSRRRCIFTAYIKRDIEAQILALTKEYSALLVTGPRQVGKTTVLRQLAEGNRDYVSLDDLEQRALAVNDPALFIQLHQPPVFIDEVQYAPQLFPYIKMVIDNGAPAGSYWLTGSQAFRMMELARESLAGRVAILHMPAMSQHELFGSGDTCPFSPDISLMRERKLSHAPADMPEIYRRIWRGALPGIATGKYGNNEVFYSSYMQTYVERDISEIMPGVDKLVFSDFIRAAACRIGQLLNVHDIAQDVGVSDDTAKRWLLALEKSEIIFYLRPYSNNLLKRTVKTPKLYFFDTGLVAYLTRYSSPEILMNGALNGAILENYTVLEIIKSYANAARDCPMWFYRDRDNKEIDMVIEADGQLHPLEIKRSVNPGTELTGVFSLLDKGTLPRGTGALLCMRPNLSAIDAKSLLIPIWMI